MILEKVHSIYMKNLGKEGLAYLHQRGITENTAKNFKLGFHSERILTKNLTEDEKKSAMFLSSTLFFDYTVFEEERKYLDRDKRIIYPLYKNGIGGNKLISFHSRSILQDSSLPHRHLTGLSYNIFNESILSDVCEVIICEGQNDCLILNQEGFPSLGVLGAGQFNKSNAENFLLNDIKKAYVLFDNDDNKSGEKGANKTAELLSEVGIPAFIGTLPKIHGQSTTDINDLYLYDKQLFREIIRKALGNAKKYKKPTRSLPRLKRNYEKFQQILISDLYDFGSSPKKEIGVKCMLPGHDDQKASFFYNPQKNVFFCQGCSRGGSVIEFFMYLNGLTRNEAIRFLEERLKNA